MVEVGVLVELSNLASREQIVMIGLVQRPRRLTKSLELLALPPPPTPRLSSMLSSMRIGVGDEYNNVEE